MCEKKEIDVAPSGLGRAEKESGSQDARCGCAAITRDTAVGRKPRREERAHSPTNNTTRDRHLKGQTPGRDKKNATTSICNIPRAPRSPSPPGG